MFLRSDAAVLHGVCLLLSSPQHHTDQRTYRDFQLTPQWRENRQNELQDRQKKDEDVN